MAEKRSWLKITAEYSYRSISLRSKADTALKSSKKDASFIEPMECLPVPKIPEGPLWVYEVKLDGYRAIAVNAKQGKPALFSRRGKSFNKKFPDVFDSLVALPRGTAIDGEIVALDDQGRPDFHLLTHSRKSSSRICFYVFDVLFFENHDATQLPLFERRELLKSIQLKTPMKLLESFQTSAAEMLSVVREHNLEGVVAKRLDSPYEPGRRSGAWVKHRVAQQDDFWIGGFIPGSHGIDSLIVGEYRGNKLMYVARVRAGLVPSSRREVFRMLQPLTIKSCPFVNLPETGRSRWGENLTAEKMKQCIWIKPKLTARIEYLERSEGGRLRHSRFVRLND
jgi:DNA ligase D-like protein (predicted ligase)